MTLYISLALALFILQTYLSPLLRYGTGGLVKIVEGMGGRDDISAPSKIEGRLKRASENMKEALPIFLTLALLAEMKGVSGGLTEWGAILFLVGRVLYIPAYVISFSGFRSFMWLIAFCGMIIMAVGIWPSLEI